MTLDKEPLSPAGYFGFCVLSFPMSVNETNQFGIIKPWGLSDVFQSYDNVTHLPPTPDEE